MRDDSALVAVYPEISDAPIQLSVPILWGDMDSANHVNNLVYLRWTETSRIKMFEKFMDTSFKGTTGPILGWHDCKYILPLTYPDQVLVTARIAEIREDRFIIQSKIYSLDKHKLSAISNQSIIPYDYVKLEKTSLPREWHPILLKLT